MRVTKEERFLRGIQDVSCWVFTQRCDKCGDDVRDESMFRKRVSMVRSNSWHYLCRTCAPTFQDAARYWRPHGGGHGR